MAQASFRFGRILRLKTQLRKATQDEVTMRRQDLARVEGDIRESEHARERNRAAAAEAALRAPTVADLRLYDAYDRGRRVVEGTLRARAAALAVVIEERRRVLLARRREERQFEVLERRQRERDAAAARHEEANLQDDLARRTARRRGGAWGGGALTALGRSGGAAGATRSGRR